MSPVPLHMKLFKKGGENVRTNQQTGHTSSRFFVWWQDFGFHLVSHSGLRCDAM